MTKQAATTKISDIKVGDRCRKDLGALFGLAQNIADIGLMHPVVVRPEPIVELTNQSTVLHGPLDEAPS